jgi:hypothetical protein
MSRESCVDRYQHEYEVLRCQLVVSATKYHVPAIYPDRYYAHKRGITRPRPCEVTELQDLKGDIGRRSRLTRLHLFSPCATAVGPASFRYSSKQVQPSCRKRPHDPANGNRSGDVSHTRGGGRPIRELLAPRRKEGARRGAHDAQQVVRHDRFQSCLPFENVST